MKWPSRLRHTAAKDRTLETVRPNQGIASRTVPRMERVTGIEPALSAWEEFLSHRVSVSCNDIGGLI